MSDLVTRLRNVAAEMAYSQETHQEWAEYMESHPEEDKSNPKVGDALHHRTCVVMYEERIQAVTQAADFIEKHYPKLSKMYEEEAMGL